MGHAIDTLRYANGLKHAGMSAEQAEGCAKALARELDDSLGRLMMLPALDALEQRLDAKLNALDAKFGAKLDAMELRMTLKLGRMLVAAVGVAGVIVGVAGIIVGAIVKLA